jgi:hypothetical protein
MVERESWSGPRERRMGEPVAEAPLLREAARS